MLPPIFRRRRTDFMSQMEGGVALFASPAVTIRNADVEYDFRQDSNFYYLTGFEEPESICVLAPGNKKWEYVLFVRPKDAEMESWTGSRAGIEGAIRDYGADMAFENRELEEILPQFLENAPALYYSFHSNSGIDRRLFAILQSMGDRARAGIYPPSRFIDPATILSEMRLIKSPEELDLLQQAADVTIAGHIAAMKTAAPGKYEYEIQAALEYEFRKRGSPRNGYPSIVASGPNCCVLHYRQNSRAIANGDLLLIDAGAEYSYYTADITRTFPANGRFSPEQKAVYEVVLNAQTKSIVAALPNKPFSVMHQTALSTIVEGLIHLGLLSGSVEENIESENYKKYFFHRTGHWLGMDVHDPGKYKVNEQWRILSEGMVVTVEPGIYISDADPNESFRGIGIRIEDDVLITKEGPVVLSGNCPKSIADIESIVGCESRS